LREFFLHKSITNLDLIKEDLKSKVQDFDSLKIIAVSKTFSIDQILPLIKHGHLDYGENKVQEAINKWSDVRLEYSDIKLHLIGKLQSNKTKLAVKLFDYIHSVDSEKIAKKIAEEELKQNKKVKIFIQVNIGDENQKSGIIKKNLMSFILIVRN
jgi:pyridoxal phosphate enzyme (YggS family)